MSKLYLKLGICGSLVLFFSFPLVYADSEARFPVNWKSWKLVKSITIPSAETKLPENLPPLFKETIRKYNWVNFGRAVDLDIYVNPAVLDNYKKGGPYPNALVSVGIFRGVNVVFVTEHRDGKALFGTYDEKGRDITNNHSSFDTKICTKCHYFYQECKSRYGICSKMPTK